MLDRSTGSRQGTAVLPGRTPRPVWKILFGFVRSKTAAIWIRHAKACCRVFHLVAMSSWSTTPDGSFARARLRSRRSWPGSLSGWGPGRPELAGPDGEAP